FYDVTEGEILIDGVNIKDMKRRDLRSLYGMVLQDTWIFTGSVKENIAYGRPDASDEEIKQAAMTAHSHSFIKRLENGYDTMLSEDGGNLSQGQKQLLSISRIMMTDPSMLILDEATSSIDTMTEQRIQRAFAKLMKGRTSFIIAHRLSTIKDADIILVMRDGNIIEQGSHDELIARNGFYTKLYNSQFEKT
ncbi:MAG: ATP-binding cassette domain-containing protein, partial [Oscillospiraceae bacterium]|nr:ATP-binding cassette domain-containing protein [Oscillospiraceae bacterium]